MSLRQTHMWHVTFLVLVGVCRLFFAFPFIFNYMVVYFFTQGNYAKALIFCLDTFLSKGNIFIIATITVAIVTFNEKFFISNFRHSSPIFKFWKNGFLYAQ